MGNVLDAEGGHWKGIDPARSDGIIRRIDPRARIIAAVLFAVLVVSLHDLVALTAALLVAIIALSLSRLPLGRTLRRMAVMDSFIIFIILMLPFTVPGEPLFEIFGLVASREGLLQAVRIALTANAVVLMLMSLVGTMDSVTLGHALHRLKAPANLVHLMLFTVRYIEVLHEEYLRLRMAMKIRAFRPSNSRHTYMSYGYLVGMMLVRAMERSERILAAMKCRGFSGHFPLLGHFRLGRLDLGFAGVFATIAGLVITLEFVRAAAY